MTSFKSDTRLRPDTDAAVGAAPTDEAATGLGESAETLGLTRTELDRIVAELSREPNPVELAVFAGMWSEHCSYKSTRELLAELPSAGTGLLAGPGSHAGCVDVGDGWAVAFKIESHNHPSAVEPYQGAATGIGGILRDVVAQGARPVAVMDALCFGEPDSARTRYLAEGIVAGIGGYGNAYGVANVGGLTVYDRRYEGNPLVNALAAGLLRHDALRTAAAGVPGDLVLYAGAATGCDGILGAAFASEELGAPDEHAGRRSHVQVADPFMGRKLMEACLSFDRGLVACQDLGACGIACAASEMAAAAGTGIDIDLSAIPLREDTMRPDQILLSESQERFLFIIDAAHRDAALRHFHSYGVHAAVCGRVTDGGRLRIRRGGYIVADLPADLVADGAPSPNWDSAPGLPAPEPYPDFPPPDDAGAVLLALLSRPGIADAAPVYTRYDQTVGNRTVLGPGQGEAAVLKLPGSSSGFALSLHGGGSGCAVHPYLGTQAVLGKVVRSLGCAGAEIVAVTDGINAGAPSDPGEYLRLREMIRSLGDGLRSLGIPVTGGNCSLYNESPRGAIPPTPMIGAVGVVADVAAVPRPAFAPGDVVFLVGDPSHRPTLSAYGRLRTGSGSGPPPAADLDADRMLAAFLVSQMGRIRSAKDGGAGGLATALAKLCIRSDLGAEVGLPEMHGRYDWLLFGESGGTAWITTAPADADVVESAAARSGVPIRRLGRTGGDRLRIGDVVNVAVPDLAAAFRRTVPG